jgi:DMSO/TMAO reductase YedYZ molybdopterin-dependent catalytic subunit
MPMKAMSPLDRRSFLKLGGVGLAGIAFAPIIGGCDSPTQPPFTLEGFTPFITPTNQFYVQHGGRDTIPGWTMPDIARNDWELTIRGSVATPMSIRIGDIEAAAAAGQKRTILKTMRCVLDSHLRPGSNGWTGNAYWTGVPLRHFLDLAGLDRANTARINFTGYDGFLNNVTLERFGESDLGDMELLLVYQMNGEPLRREHGAPVRLVMLETFGYKSIKWLKDVNVSIHDRVVGTYQREGFVDDGVIRVTSRSENFAENIAIAPGAVEITGHALSGAGKITAVEVSIDNGPFQAAEIEPRERVLNGLPLPPDIVQLQSRDNYPIRGVWTKWRFRRWNATVGTHTVAIRASDASGATQTFGDVEIKDGLTGIARYSVTVA